MNPDPVSVLELRDVACGSADGSGLRGISIAFAPASITVLRGAEGCGKNRLLRVLGLLDPPDAGDVLLHGVPTRRLDPDARGALRNRHFGFLFAQPFLLPAFSAIENVAMPLFKISGLSSDEARPRVDALLEFVGATGYANTPVEELPLPEQQHVALARALANEPDVLIAENPETGLDGDALSHFLNLLRRVVAERGVTVLASASAPVLSAAADRVIEFAAGGILSDTLSEVAGGGAPA